MLDQQSLLIWLDQKIRSAEQEYSLHTGTQGVCQLHKDGRVTGGLKYDEGRLVALTAARRIARKVQDTGDNALIGALLAERDRWRQTLITYQSADRPSILWIAYNQGGVDALDELLAPVKDGDNDQIIDVAHHSWINDPLHFAYHLLTACL